MGCGRRRHQVPLPVELPDLLLAATIRTSSTRRRSPVQSRPNAGQSWKAISPDLTRNDKSKQGADRRADHQGQHQRRVLRHDLLRSPSRRSSRACSGPARTTASSTSPATAARHWDERHAAKAIMPEWIMINEIDASPLDKGDGLRRGHDATSRTTSTPISTRRPTTARPGRRSSTAFRPTHFTRVIRADPKRRGLLYAGTERGVYVSFDDGGALAVAAAQPADRSGPRPARSRRRR